MEEKKPEKPLFEQALEQVSEEAKQHVELMDTTIPISEMFLFIEWRDEQRWYHENANVSKLDLWNKYQDEKNKQK